MGSWMVTKVVKFVANIYSVVPRAHFACDMVKIGGNFDINGFQRDDFMTS